MPRSDFLVVRTDPDLEKLAAKFRINRHDEIAAGVDKATKITAKHIRREAPVKTGKLRKSIRVHRVGKGQAGLRREISENVDPPYGLFQRQGVPARKINPILPVRKKALFWPGARHPVRAVYNHPGIKPNDYWLRGLQSAEPKVNQIADDVAKDIATDIIDTRI
jgi:hypothetical protein